MIFLIKLNKFLIRNQYWNLKGINNYLNLKCKSMMLKLFKKILILIYWVIKKTILNLIICKEIHILLKIKEKENDWENNKWFNENWWK